MEQRRLSLFHVAHNCSFPCSCGCKSRYFAHRLNVSLWCRLKILGQHVALTEIAELSWKLSLVKCITLHFPFWKRSARWCISVIFAKCNRMTGESKSKEEKKMLKYCEDSLEHVEKREPRQGSDDRLGILMIRPLGVWQQKSHSNKVLWALQKHWKNDDGDKI